MNRCPEEMQIAIECLRLALSTALPDYNESASDIVNRAATYLLFIKGCEVVNVAR